MALSAKHNIPDLPPFKLITVLRHYTYLWPYTARVRFGRVTRVRDNLRRRGHGLSGMAR